MERRIFDEHLPCTPDGQASPFAATKMLYLPYISPTSPLYLPYRQAPSPRPRCATACEATSTPNTNPNPTPKPTLTLPLTLTLTRTLALTLTLNLTPIRQPLPLRPSVRGADPHRIRAAAAGAGQQLRRTQ